MKTTSGRRFSLKLNNCLLLKLWFTVYLNYFLFVCLLFESVDVYDGCALVSPTKWRFWSGRPKKCAQCVQCAQCGPPITALRTEQDQKLAAQCARREAPTVSHPPPRQQTGLGLPDENLFGLFCRMFYRPGIPQKAFTFLRYTLFGLFILGELYQARIRFCK